MEADQVVNRGLNEIVSRRIGALVSRGKNFDSRLAESKQALEAANNELPEENKELSKQKEQLCEDKVNLTQDLLETRETLRKANETKEKFKESAKLSHQEYVQLELDLIASRQEAEELGKRVRELKEAGARDLKKYKEATHLCFYEF
ncbi:uncharacterized protein LOC133832261 [Humulus lupulus]|uniref:uncharacterized protein LOC133832261 n=1 Tax=Humulus lupulus TaxID=3486 RepID=UPI002B403CE2|nr:uncharacterized protein LOC133832261 [Humulus lupulus]